VNLRRTQVSEVSNNVRTTPGLSRRSVEPLGTLLVGKLRRKVRSRREMVRMLTTKIRTPGITKAVT